MEGNKGMCSAHGHQGLAQAARCLDGKQAAENAARELFGVFGSCDRTTKKLELQDTTQISPQFSRFFQVLFHAHGIERSANVRYWGDRYSSRPVYIHLERSYEPHTLAVGERRS